MGLKTQVLSVARFPKEDSICKFFFLSSGEKEARKLHTPPRKKASPGGRKACQETRRLPAALAERRNIQPCHVQVR